MFKIVFSRDINARVIGKEVLPNVQTLFKFGVTQSKVAVEVQYYTLSLADPGI